MKTAGRSFAINAALIVLLTVVAYLPTTHAGFVWDDHELISGNPLVKASDGLYRFWFTSDSPDYRPLAWSLWWLEWRWWGANPTGYHVLNVLLHAVNAVLVWIILRRLNPAPNAFGTGLGAWLTALVFAIHPVNVATVAWISEQKNTLSMLFFALSILLYLKFDDEGHWGWYGLSLVAGLLAFLTKTAVAMLPVVLLGCMWWRHGKVQRRDWLCSVPYLAAALALALVTIVQHRRVLEGTTVHVGDFAVRLATAGCLPWFYLSKALLPVGLTAIYPKWEIDASRWISYVPGVILIGALIVFWWRRNTWGRPLLFGLGYFLVMLFPVLGFFDQAFYRLSLMADHWQYYSIIGVIALVVAGGQKISNQMGEWGRRGALLVAAIVLVVLELATWRRGSVYANDEALWRDNLATNPNAWQAYYNLGVALQQTGRMQEAMTQWEQAVRVNPDYAQAHYDLGVALAHAGKIQEALQHFEQAVRISPGFADAHCNLGIALMRLGRTQEAIEEYQKALRFKPNLPDAHYNLGLVLEQTGKRQQAIGEYEQALQLKPDYAEAHFSLALALEQTGQVREAIDHYEHATRINPNYVLAQNNLAWLLATQAPAVGGDPARAVALAQRACELTGNRVAPYLDTLAAAYAAAGRFTEAIEAAQKGVELARSAGQPQVAAEIERHLEMYRAGQANRW